MLRGETTKRLELDPDRLVAKLQIHGIEQLRDEPHVWVVVDGSDLRKPHAREMEHLQRLKRLDWQNTVNGYPTLSVGTALAPLGCEVTGIFDSGFDDQAVWGEAWDHGWHLVCRLKHRDRLVHPAPGVPHSAWRTWLRSCGAWPRSRQRWSSRRRASPVRNSNRRRRRWRPRRSW